MIRRQASRQMSFRSAANRDKVESSVATPASACSFGYSLNSVSMVSLILVIMVVVAASRCIPSSVSARLEKVGSVVVVVVLAAMKKLLKVGHLMLSLVRELGLACV